jgi:hypothetical protein
MKEPRMYANERKYRPDPRGDQSGIALVIVLGFITVLTILGVGFVVSMRTERLAGRYHLDAVRARYYCKIGLARAMDDFEDHMDNENLIIMTNEYRNFYKKTNYYDESWIEGSASNFLAWSYWDLDNNGMITPAPDDLAWSNIYVDVDGTNTLVGRYKYIITDASGHFDINTAYGSEARNDGSSPLELNVDGFLSGSLATSQAAYVRFETTREIDELIGDGTSYHFVPYTRFPPRLQTNGAPRIRLDTEYTQRSRVTNAFARCGITNTAWVYSNLLDYIDSDHVPQNVQSFCTESVPMINEVVLEFSDYQYSAASSNLLIEARYIVETWYPFPSVKTSAELVMDAPSISVNGSVSGTMTNVGGLSASISSAPNSYATNSFRFQYTELMPALPATAPNLTGQPGVIRVTDGSGTDFDLADVPPFGAGASVTWAPASARQSSAAVVDPRINWLPSHWQTESPPTLLAENSMAAGVNEGVSQLYVRDAVPSNTAELGFLSVGENWQTIALYSSPGRPLNPVLDHFMVAAETNVMRGLINPLVNSNRFAHAFEGALIERYPGDSSPTAVSSAESDEISEEWSTIVSSNGISWIGNAVRDSIIGGSYTDAQRESIIANTHRLLNPRENTLQVIVVGQAVATPPGGSVTNVLAEQRAFAEIWRDPFLHEDDDDGTHDAFIRLFRWLPD